MNFDELYQIVNEVGGEMAFNQNEARSYYKAINKYLKNGDIFVELGVEFGRSTTIAAQLAKETGFYHYAVDNFMQSNSSEAKNTVLSRISKYQWNNTEILSCSTYAARSQISSRWVQGIFIDASHIYEDVKNDIKTWLPRLGKSKPVMFHDYGRDSLPGVKMAVDEFIESGELIKKLHVDTFLLCERN